MNIVIVGASSGIGRALAIELATANDLYIGARRLSLITYIAAGRCTAWPIDVVNETSVKSFFKGCPTPIDGLIIAAAEQGPIGPFYENSVKEWCNTVDTNLKGTFLCMKYAVPMMKEGSRIVTFAGGGAFNTRPDFSAYAASKAACVRLMETAAEELAPRGIAVNAIAPGFVSTEIHFNTPSKYLNEKPIPIEVPVNCVKWLLSDEAKGLTGKTISAPHDPWAAPNFVEHINNYRPDLYTMKRIA